MMRLAEPDAVVRVDDKKGEMSVVIAAAELKRFRKEHDSLPECLTAVAQHALDKLSSTHIKNVNVHVQKKQKGKVVQFAAYSRSEEFVVMGGRARRKTKNRRPLVAKSRIR